MKNVLKVYDVELRVEGPVFIGSGREITKKEYTFLNSFKTAYIFDTVKLVAFLKKRNLYNEFEKYMMGTEKQDLGKWLISKGITSQEFEDYTKYKCDCSDMVIDNPRELKILEFMRDSYGNPYVPGSSLKGALRTVLLANDIRKNPKKYSDVLNNSSQYNRADKRYYNSLSNELENRFANVLNRDNKKRDNAVNDFMSGIIVSDSEVLSLKDIMLCQRTDLHVDGKETHLPVLRECIKPGTVIKFKLTVDESVCNIQKSYVITENEILDAVRNFCLKYNDSFVRKFNKIEARGGDCIWIGGSSGFATKTEIYQMYNSNEAVKTIVDIFLKTGVPRQHKHEMDTRYGVSPHICKVANYKGKYCEIGKCVISIEKC